MVPSMSTIKHSQNHHARWFVGAMSSSALLLLLVLARLHGWVCIAALALTALVAVGVAQAASAAAGRVDREMLRNDPGQVTPDIVTASQNPQPAGDRLDHTGATQ